MDRILQMVPGKFEDLVIISLVGSIASIIGFIYVFQKVPGKNGISVKTLKCRMAGIQ